MSERTYPYKITADDWWNWIAAPEGGDGDERSKLLIANRHDLEVVGEVVDSEASYSYDDWALVRLKGKYYLLSTSGCSCPSPSETWGVQHGPMTLSQIRKEITNGNYQGYTVPGRQMQEFLDMIDAERERRRRKE
jgi:hypothetical protein